MKCTGIIKLYNEGGGLIKQTIFRTIQERRKLFKMWVELDIPGSYIQISLNLTEIHKKDVVDKPVEHIVRPPAKYDNDKSLYNQ